MIALRKTITSKYLYKRILCFVLCVLLITLTMAIDHQEAYAFFPLVIAGVTIAPEVVAAGATLLCAAGLTFTTSDDAQNAFYEMWCNASENFRTNVSAIGTGIVDVSDSVWTAVTDWVSSTYSVGANSVTNYISYYGDNCYPVSNSVDVWYPIGMEFEYGSDIYTLTAVSTGTVSGKPFTNYKLGKNGETIATYYNEIGCLDSGMVSLYLYTTGVKLVLCVLGLDKYSEAYETRSTYSLSNNSEVPIAANTYSVTGQNVISSTYDFKSTDGARTISVSSTVDSVVGKTYSEVQNPTVPAIPITAYSNTWTGTFGDCATGEYTFEGSGTYTGTLTVAITGTWVGEWTWTGEGIRVWTGTFTGVDALTWTGTATESIDSTSSSTTDYSNWKIPADTLKNKFPFSIPWDLQRAITSLVATPEAPKWTITFPSNVFIGGGEVLIDFSIFESWALIVRWGILISFNIFLILTTRKIIGAS